MRILITGGNGFIGSNLVNLLSKNKKNEIIVLDIFERTNSEVRDNVVFIKERYYFHV